MEVEKSIMPKPTALTGLTIIEKVSEVRWTLQLAQAVLFADLALLWKTGHGILEWSASTDQLLGNSGILVVSLIVFGVFASIVLPVVGMLFRTLAWQLIINLPIPQWLQTERDYTRKFGSVRPIELLNLALKENSAFLFGIYKEHSQKQTKEQVAQLEAGNLIFAVLVLATANMAANWLGLSGISLIAELCSALGEQANLVLAVAAFMTFIALKWTWFSDWDSGWIYYPPLAKRLSQNDENKCL